MTGIMAEMMDGDAMIKQTAVLEGPRLTRLQTILECHWVKSDLSALAQVRSECSALPPAAPENFKVLAEVLCPRS